MKDNKNIQSIQRDIMKIIAKYGKVELSKIAKVSNLSELGIDSFAFLEIIAEIEKKYKIFIPDDDFDKIKTIKDLKKLVEKYINSAK